MNNLSVLDGGQRLVVANHRRIVISVRPEQGVSLVVEDEDGEAVVQARYGPGWRQLTILGDD